MPFSAGSKSSTNKLSTDPTAMQFPKRVHHSVQILNNFVSAYLLEIQSLLAACLQSIRLGSHDEIVSVQTANFMSPPLNGHSAPLRHNQGMVSFFFRDRAYSVRELQCLREILEFEDSLQPLHAVHFLELPTGYLRLEFCDLFVRQGRFTAATGDAL
jgi:hypothetical protein